MKKTILLLAICMFAIHYNACTQNSVELDSIKKLLLEELDPKEEVSNYLKLTRLSIGVNLDSAQSYLQEAIKTGVENELNKELSTAYTFLANINYIQGEIDSSSISLKKAHQFAIEAGDSLRAINTLHNLAVIYHATSQYDKAKKQVESNLLDFISLKDSLQMGNCYLLLANIYRDQGYAEVALKNAHAALDMHRAFDNPYLQAEDNLIIGLLQDENDDHESAIESIKKSIFLYEKAGKIFNTAQAYNALSSCYLDIENFQQAETYSNKAMEIGKSFDSKSNIARSSHYLGLIKSQNKQRKEAKTYFLNSIDLYEQIESESNIQTVKLDLAKVHMEQGNHEIVNRILSEVIKDSKKISYPSTECKAYYASYELNKKIGNEKNALHFIEQFKVLKDSLFGEEKEKALQALHLKYETEQKEKQITINEQEIKTLNQEVRISNLKRKIFGLLFGLAMSVLILAVLIYRQKIKRNKREAAMREKLLNQELVFKQKELTSQTLHLVQKNQFIQNISERLEKIQDSENNLQMESAKILSSLKLEPELDKDWMTFKSYFSQVHDHYDEKLKSKCSDLSENDMRLAYLLKMKMNTNEIASMLHVLPESVRKSKYRLKKKFNLDKDQDLTNYLVEI